MACGFGLRLRGDFDFGALGGLALFLEGEFVLLALDRLVLLRLHGERQFR